LFATYATQELDDTGRSVIGGGYAVIVPAIRQGLLIGAVARQGSLVVRNNHVLRPAVAVNAQGKGAIAFTLAGPDYYPSAAFVPVEGFIPGTTAQIAAPGVAPEDGFTGYPDNWFFGPGVARWGDYSSATAMADGTVWMTIEYIPDALRTPLANWGTHLVRFPR
jgi:hypothetical protein